MMLQYMQGRFQCCVWKPVMFRILKLSVSCDSPKEHCSTSCDPGHFFPTPALWWLLWGSQAQHPTSLPCKEVPLMAATPRHLVTVVSILQSSKRVCAKEVIENAMAGPHSISHWLRDG